MTTEEQVQVREAWSRLRNLAQYGTEGNPAYDQETAYLVKDTIRSLLKTAYDAATTDCREHPNADAEAKAQFRDLSVSQIMDALGIGTEV